MKKFNLLKNLILGAAIFGTTVINAQTIVSTSPMNKRVVLEEFTGIHCGYCPDGHRIAHDIQVAHPGVFFPIAIHEGSFATPSSGEPDYRTTFGNSIGTLCSSSTIGWPSGAINRHQYTGSVLAMSRSSWSTYTNTALGQTSCVNVATTANVNYSTRELTVLVEVYYTANSTQSTNKLNVAICQNNVKGPQSGSSANPTMVTPDGQYLHQHMFRHFLTGQWGVTIPTTTTGTFFTQTFTYTIPASYTNIPVEIPQLEIIAFVSEGNTEILSADRAFVNQPTIDASISSISNVPVYTCTGSFAPTVTVKNNGTSTLTSATINYSIDGGTVSTYSWTGSLATGATSNVVLPTINATNGSHTLTVSTISPNGSTDLNTVNDAYSSNFSVFSVGSMTPISQAFTSSTFPPTNYAIVDADPDGKCWARGSAGHSAAGSAFINFYNISSGKKDDLILPLADFSNTTNTSLSFWVAYRQYGSENDKLEVDVSTNCGTSWTQKWTKQGAALSTGAAYGSGNWTSPTAGEWRQETVDLTSYNGQNNIMIRFRATSAYGNNAFVDDINLTGNITGFENPDFNDVVKVFPNPSNGNLNIVNASNSIINIYDMLGNIVYTKEVSTENESIDISSLSNGSYIAKISNENKVISKNIVLVK